MGISLDQVAPGGATNKQDNGLSLLSVHAKNVQPNEGAKHSASYGGDLSAAPISQPAPADSSSWTYLVNLTATMLPPNQAGSGYKFKLLENLKEDTKSSHAEVMVQAFDADTGMLQRYKIAHGQISQFAPVRSLGTYQDLQNLIAQAPKDGHLGLINEAHGNGDVGFDGDAGKYSVSQFGQAIKRGLASNGHAPLDFLSMDSCLMSNVQVLAALSGLTENVVASEFEEFSITALSSVPPETIYDMQPIDQYLSALIKHEPKDGKEAVNRLLSISAKGCDALTRAQDGCGTPTLGVYNLATAPEAERALDDFGKALQLAIKNPSTRRNVDSLIAGLPDVSVAGDHLRDVDGFATGVINLIQSGAVKDGDHRLKQSAEDVLKADKNLVQSLYVNTKARIISLYGNKPIHGLNTYLPGTELDIRADAESIVGSMQAQTLPVNTLLNDEIQSSLPDSPSGGWAGFVKSLRSQ
jgi:hypothetical protein